MRKIVSALFITLNGVVGSPEQWQFDHFDEEMMAAMAAQVAAEDSILLGRTTYEEWLGYWPSVNDQAYATHINSTPKYVASTTLDRVEWGGWGNATLLDGDLANTVGELKRQPGKNIGVAGSPTLVRSLLAHNLLDELTLMVHPVVAGRGKRLFGEGDELKRLRLSGSRITPSGVALLTYQPHTA